MPPPCLRVGEENLQSLVLFQHQLQQYKQNLTNLNYGYGYFSMTCFATFEINFDPN